MSWNSFTSANNDSICCAATTHGDFQVYPLNHDDTIQQIYHYLDNLDKSNCCWYHDKSYWHHDYCVVTIITQHYTIFSIHIIMLLYFTPSWIRCIDGSIVRVWFFYPTLQISIIYTDYLIQDVGNWGPKPWIHRYEEIRRILAYA